MAQLDDIVLPDDLQWINEFTGWRVGQARSISLSGALIVQESEQQAGRPITLQSGSTGSAFFGVITHAVAEALRAKVAASAGAANMTLTLPAYPTGVRTFTVRFRHDDGALDAAPIDVQMPAEPDDLYTLTLRLMVV